MFDVYEIELTLLQEQLGTNPLNPEVLKNHIIDRQRKLILEKSKINKEINKYKDSANITVEQEKEELLKAIQRLEEFLGQPISDEGKDAIFAGRFEVLKETMTELDQKGTTIFHKDQEGRPCIGNHMIYGFMKAASEAISRTKSREKGKINQSASYTASIINQHIKITPRFISFDKEMLPGYFERSLRAETAQGPRITLARSEVVPVGAKLKFKLMILKDSPLKEEHIREIFGYGALRGLGQFRNADYGSFSAFIVKE